MGTRKAKKSNKKFRKTRSTRQKGGDNVNAKDANGSTALIRASWDGDTEIVAMLLEKGADVNAKDAKGSTGSYEGKFEWTHQSRVNAIGEGS